MRLIIFVMFVSVIFSACDLEEVVNEPDNQFILKKISEFDLEISEPSGLTYDPNTQTLWTVNDPDNNQVYNISLTGELIQTLDFVGEDLEGIAYDNSTNSLWIVEEGLMEIVNLSLEGEELLRIELPNHQNSSNAGLEGICIDNFGNLNLLKEKDPGLFIQLNQDYSIASEIELTFADDYSGIFFDETRNGFWIVSDESQTLYLWDSENGVREQFFLDIPKAEGIVYVAETGHVYIVSDSEQKLYKFHFEEQ